MKKEYFPADIQVDLVYVENTFATCSPTTGNDSTQALEYDDGE